MIVVKSIVIIVFYNWSQRKLRVFVMFVIYFWIFC